jgi:hypothetical protein
MDRFGLLRDQSKTSYGERIEIIPYVAVIIYGNNNCYCSWQRRQLHVRKRIAYRHFLGRSIFVSLINPNLIKSAFSQHFSVTEALNKRLLCLQNDCTQE